MDSIPDSPDKVSGPTLNPLEKPPKDVSAIVWILSLLALIILIVGGTYMYAQYIKGTGTEDQLTASPIVELTPSAVVGSPSSAPVATSPSPSPSVSADPNLSSVDSSLSASDDDMKNADAGLSDQQGDLSEQ